MLYETTGSVCKAAKGLSSKNTGCLFDKSTGGLRGLTTGSMCAKTVMCLLS